MFRIKVRIDPELLKPHATRVDRPPRVGYVRRHASAEWPEILKTRDDVVSHG